MLTEQNQSCDPERGFFQGEAYLSHSRYVPTAVPWMWDWKQTENSKHNKGKRTAPKIVGEVGG